MVFAPDHWRTSGLVMLAPRLIFTLFYGGGWAAIQLGIDIVLLEENSFFAENYSFRILIFFDFWPLC
jgi:hypothetical protein